MQIIHSVCTFHIPSHPWVGKCTFAGFLYDNSGILTTMLSWSIAHIWSVHGCELGYTCLYIMLPCDLSSNQGHASGAAIHLLVHYVPYDLTSNLGHASGAAIHLLVHYVAIWWSSHIFCLQVGVGVQVFVLFNDTCMVSVRTFSVMYDHITIFFACKSPEHRSARK